MYIKKKTNYLAYTHNRLHKKLKMFVLFQWPNNFYFIKLCTFLLCVSIILTA